MSKKHIQQTVGKESINAIKQKKNTNLILEKKIQLSNFKKI